MDRQEWLKWRRIGSSDAPIIMGVSPWTTPYQLYLQKVTGQERADNANMKRGRDMEETARKHLEKMTGMLFAPTNLESKQWEFMTASLDGYDADNRMIAEIKCPGEKDHAKALKNEVPEKYFPQLQHQMAVAETEKMIYFSFNGNEGVSIAVNRDDAYIKKMIQAESEFWERLLSQTPPNKTLKDEPYHEPEEGMVKKLQILKNASDQKDYWEQQEKEARKEIIEMAIGRNIQFPNAKLYQSLTKGSVQYDQIPELRNVNLDLYRKEPYLKWTLRFN
jgi:putative phage-type endonuclease